MFWRPNDSRKRKCYISSGYKERTEMSLVYFEGKLQQNMYAFQVKMLESGRKNIFRGKKTRDKVPLMF